MTYDAVVVGAGPNGLSAAVELARAGLSVLVREARPEIGGGARSAELTRPGFVHDVGSAVHPLGVGSPFFASCPLEAHGLRWLHSEAPLAHPLDGGRAVVLERDLNAARAALGRDGAAYGRLVEPFVRMWPSFADFVLDAPTRVPRDPVLAARFGLRALAPASWTARGLRSEEGRALWAGNAAHGGIPLERPPSGAIGVVLMAAAHAVGWPIPRGGAGAITTALASYLRELGGEIETGAPVGSLDQLPPARATLLDLTYRQVAEVAGGRLPAGHADRLRAWSYGVGAFKVDWALKEPIPWSDANVARAVTVHVGGRWEEIAAAERAPWEGRVAERPFVLLAQPTTVDPTRAPRGHHTAWGYCHVPLGWDGDATDAIEAQVERFAPGFRDTIVARVAAGPADLEATNPNLIGGNVSGGAPTLGQTFGPWRRAVDPWGTPVEHLYVCSASTPPGAGVHGMCGYHAARTALRRSFGRA